MVALDRDGLELVVVDLDIGAFGVFVAATLVFGLHRLAGDLVDQLLAQPVAGFFLLICRNETRSLDDDAV